MAPDTADTRELDRYLAEATPEQRSAETSLPVPAADWQRYLAVMPAGVAVRPAEGVITRSALFKLAEVDREEQSQRSALDLFWNTMAWGIAGTWRNIPRLANGVAADVDRAAEALRQAQRLSFAGEVRGSYQALNGSIKYLGPAFFTKFLYFTADRSQAAYALILDERVRVAWQILTGEELQASSSADYARYCHAAGDSGRRAGLQPDEVEACLYHLGRRARSYTSWLEASLRLCRERLGAGAPSTREVLGRLS